MTLTIKSMNGYHTVATFSSFSTLEVARNQIIQVAKSNYNAQIIENSLYLEIIVFSDNDCRSLVKLINNMI